MTVQLEIHRPAAPDANVGAMRRADEIANLVSYLEREGVPATEADRRQALSMLQVLSELVVGRDRIRERVMRERIVALRQAIVES